MKTHIILALALLIVSASAGTFGVDVKKLIATKTSGVIDKDDLASIISSGINQYTVVTTFFSKGDFAGTGKLTSVQFGLAYSAFMKFLLGETPSVGLIGARWSIAVMEQDQDKYIDLAGFTFLVTLDLRFVYDNYCLFDGNLHKVPTTIKTLQAALGTVETNDIIAACFFGADFNKNSEVTAAEFRSGLRILGYILGVNISYTTPLLNDLFSAADANGNGVLSPAEVTGYINEHLGTIEQLLNIVATA